MVPLPELTEASGLAVSRRHLAGSGRTTIRAGRSSSPSTPTAPITARVRLTGATVEDWEAIAIGPCPAGSCIYVADIGDNNAARTRITIYRVPEPRARGGLRAGGRSTARDISGRAHDAETLLVTPRGELFIVTKGAPGGGAIYKFPRDLKAGATHPLERVGEPRPIARAGRSENITDGAVSADGAWVALRTGQRVAFYRAGTSLPALAGSRRDGLAVARRSPGRGAVAFGADASLYLAGEGGRKSRPGSLAHLSCALD